MPTLIASIFGMNFRLPFEQHVWGFYAINGLMLGLMVAIFIYAKKHNWL
mgnify:CR=1 FL=1